MSNIGSYLISTKYNDTVFTIGVPQVFKFGMGVSREAGYEAKKLGLKSILMIVDRKVAETKIFEEVKASIEGEGIKVYVTTHIHYEPTDTAIIEAYKEVKDLQIDGFLALGGGSTIDTAKALNLLYCYPADIMDYVSKPIGKGIPPPGPLKPLIAIPTTAGTGSETTPTIVLDIEKLKLKTGIRHAYIRPTVALVDPLTTITMPPMVTASSALDVLTHAAESLTAHPYTARPALKSPDERPVYVGATPIGDIFAIEAIKWVNKYIRRAYANPYDMEARYYLALGASIAGIGFGHVGVHVPHSMAYPIAGKVKKWHPPDYEFGYPIVPHGIAVTIPAPYAFKYLTPYNYEKFIMFAKAVGLDVEGLTIRELGEVIYEYLIELLEDLKIPTTLKEIGFGKEDLNDLVEGTLAQRGLLARAPKTITKEDIQEIFLEMIE